MFIFLHITVRLSFYVWKIVANLKICRLQATLPLALLLSAHSGTAQNCFGIKICRPFAYANLNVKTISACGIGVGGGVKFVSF